MSERTCPVTEGRCRTRPILFSGPMVRALLADTKTQTRRIVKGTALEWLDHSGFTPAFVADPDNGLCPYGVPGDLLVVRETWACHCATNDQRPRDIDPHIWSVRYAADGRIRPAASDGSRALSEQFTKTRVSIHMPRWASRLTLEITDVRVERLQDISAADCLAEGAPIDYSHRDTSQDGSNPVMCLGDNPWTTQTPKAWYHRLWDEINGPGAWDANPFVWAVSFRVHQQNVDALLREREAA